MRVVWNAHQRHVCRINRGDEALKPSHSGAFAARLAMDRGQTNARRLPIPKHGLKSLENRGEKALRLGGAGVVWGTPMRYMIRSDFRV
ncbi:MAG: hypothetical protein WA702_14090 [Bradyrhizobium sp.]|jgi:hypothetical protein